MSNQKSMYAGLSDFSFQDLVTPQLLKPLYAIALLAGGISLVVFVFQALQQSPAQGLLALVFGLIGLVVWILYIRVALEVVVVLFRIAENTRRMAGG